MRPVGGRAALRGELAELLRQRRRERGLRFLDGLALALRRARLVCTAVRYSR